MFETNLSVGLNHGLAMARVDFEPAVRTQSDPERQKTVIKMCPNNFDEKAMPNSAR